MAGPMAGIPVSATEIAQQKLQQDPAQQPLKQGASKFDGVLADKAQAARGPEAAGQVQQVQQVQAPQQVDQAQRVGQVGRIGETDKVATARGAMPAEATNRSEGANKFLSGVVEHLEQGQNYMDSLISQGMSGKQFSNAELISLQAGMYKYTQELDLTSKVVEKATSGIKDTLKTQV